MKYLTTDEHREVVTRLVDLARSRDGTHAHNAGWEYTSLMVCFLLHSMGAAESLIELHKRFGNEWFPVTTGYVVARSLFEVDVNAHYLSGDPVARSRRYIEFEHVIRKSTLEAIERHRASGESSWREALQLMYNHEYAPRKAEIDAEYDRVRAQFENAKGKRATNWAGKSIREMAADVDHLEAYDIFYADLSAFTHVNVMLANRFLRLQNDDIGWTMRANEYDVGNVFRYTATFLTCFLQLFGKQFGLWDEQRVMSCWNIPGSEGRQPRLPEK
jgi:hypothetical protein